MKRVYFDTEFTGLHQETKLISIGLVTTDRHSFYGEFNDFEGGFVCEQDRTFFKTQLLPKLTYQGQDELVFVTSDPYYEVEACGKTSFVKSQLTLWLMKVLGYEQAQMWSDCLAYDWVLFCELWEGALNLPKYIHCTPMDLSTLLQIKGVDPDISREEFAADGADGAHLAPMQKHNAGWDARMIKLCTERAEKMLDIPITSLLSSTSPVKTGR